MAIKRELKWVVAADGAVTPTIPLDGGAQGDHNQTRAIFEVAEGSAWSDPANAIYIECDDGAGNVDTTEQLSVVGGKVAYLIPRAWTQYGGTVTLRLVAEGPGVGEVQAYSAEALVRLDSRQNAMKKVDSLLKGRIAAAEKKVVGSAEAAVYAADSAVASASAASLSLQGAQLASTAANEAAEQAAASTVAAGAHASNAAQSAAAAKGYAEQAAQSGAVRVYETEEDAIDVCDEDGNVAVTLSKDGELYYAGKGSGGGGGTGYFNYKQCGLPVLYLKEKEAGAHRDMINAALPKNNYEKLEKDFDYTLKTAKGSAVSSGTCSLKFQGSSSLRNQYPKYNYTFKAKKGLEFEAVRDNTGANRVVAWPKDGEREITQFDNPWGDQRKYCLKANFIDPSGARNVASARLWASIVNSRADSKVVEAADARLTASPNCGAVDGFPVIIELNGEFRGLYTFNIPKEDWMFNGVNGEGDIKYIVGGESNDEPAAGFDTLAEFPEGLAQKDTDFAIEYIPDEDDPVAKQELIDSFNYAISAVMDAKAQAKQNPDYDWEAAVSPYFDIASAIDYYIFTCCISGVDNTRKNILYATYGSTEEGVPDKWFMSAYDLDTTFGSNPYGKGLYKVKTSNTQFLEASSRHNLFYLIYNYSHDKLVERYKELRRDILSTENVWYVFNNFVNAIPKAVYNADADRWASALITRPMPATTTANVETFMQYYRMHCALLDKEMEE